MKFIAHPDLLPQKGIPGSKLTIWRKEREGKFPRRTVFSPVRYAWAEQVVDAYVRAMAAGADPVTATKIAESKRPVLEAAE